MLSKHGAIKRLKKDGINPLFSNKSIKSILSRSDQSSQIPSAILTASYRRILVSRVKWVHLPERSSNPGNSYTHRAGVRCKGRCKGNRPVTDHKVTDRDIQPPDPVDNTGRRLRESIAKFDVLVKSMKV